MYSDSKGTEVTTITNDGETLRMFVRGCEFSGGSFDSFFPSHEATADQLEQFSLYDDCLCACQIKCSIPIPIFNPPTQTNGHLEIEVDLGNPTRTGSLDREDLRISLCYEDKRIVGSGKSGWFEDELLEIQAQLPDGIYMMACINCQFSD